MILLAFSSCFLASFFFVKDQIAFFQLKQIAVALKGPGYVYLFHCVTQIEFNYLIMALYLQQIRSVWTWNMNNYLIVKQFCNTP